MPGIVVALGGFSTDRLRAAVQKLVYVLSHRSEAVSLSAELAIGWAGPRERIDSQTWADEPGHEVHVWRYGHTFKDAATPQPIDAAQILRDYMSEGIKACYEYEGCFVIVVADLRLQRLYVVPDRLSTQPLYYTRAGDDIVIGPEVKALSTVIARAPTLSRDGLIGFLSIGYDIAARTAFNDIQRVEMGKMLEITLDRPRRCTARRFWKMDFSSTHKLTDRRDAEDALLQSIKHAHRLLLSDQPTFQILLSGGADSRGILATCCLLGVLPATAIAGDFCRMRLVPTQRSQNRSPSAAGCRWTSSLLAPRPSSRIASSGRMSRSCRMTTSAGTAKDLARCATLTRLATRAP